MCCLATLSVTEFSGTPCVWNSSSPLRHTDPSTPALVSRQAACRSQADTVDYKAIHLLLTPHLASDCQLVTAAGRRHLRSSDVPTLTIMPTSTRFSDRCFLSVCSCAAMEQSSSFASTAGRERDIQTVHKTAEVTLGLLRLRRSETFAQRGRTTTFYLLTYLLTARLRRQDPCGRLILATYCCYSARTTVTANRVRSWKRFFITVARKTVKLVTIRVKSMPATAHPRPGAGVASKKFPLALITTQNSVALYHIV